MPPAPGCRDVRRSRILPLALAVALASAATAEPPAAPLSRGDEAWRRRATGARQGRADPGPIGEAVTAYARALEAAPDAIPIRERLLRALYFQARFATAEGPAQRAIYARGRDLAEAGLERLGAELGRRLDPRSPQETAAAVAERREAAALFFWAAAHLGLWAESAGAFAAARQGVAGRIRDYAEITLLVDERYEDAGGHRILGRLHTEAPRIPMITGWVDRDLAVASLERAVALAPTDPLNHLYLADALLRFRPRRREEAVSLLESLAATAPRPDAPLEDRRARDDARRLLEDAGG